MSNRGYFGIGIYHPKRESNVGIIWRHSNNFGAQFLFTVGRRYIPQSSDTSKTIKHKPLFHYNDFENFINHLPRNSQLVGVELTEYAISLDEFKHPERAVYLLGAEDHGLPEFILEKCNYVIKIPTLVNQSMNVAVAGSLIMYDRLNKKYTKE